MNTGEKADGDKARRFRDRAQECRSHAAEMHDPEARVGLIQVAQSYEVMAQRIEARLAGRKPPQSD
jgi:hypothetical protein